MPEPWTRVVSALEDPDPAVQYRAVAALKQVSGRDLGKNATRGGGINRATKGTGAGKSGD